MIEQFHGLACLQKTLFDVCYQLEYLSACPRAVARFLLDPAPFACISEHVIQNSWCCVLPRFVVHTDGNMRKSGNDLFFSSACPQLFRFRGKIAQMFYWNISLYDASTRIDPKSCMLLLYLHMTDSDMLSFPVNIRPDLILNQMIKIQTSFQYRMSSRVHCLCLI